MDLFRIKKSIKIFMCSVLTIVVMATSALSFSFRSEASAIGLDIGSTDVLSSLYSLLLSGKFVMDTTRNPFTTDSVNSDLAELEDWFEELNSYRAGLGDDIKSAIISGTIDGSIYLDATARKDFLDALDTLYPSGTMPIMKASRTLPLNEADFVTQLVIQYHTNGDPTVRSMTVDFHSTSPYFFVRVSSSGNYPLRFWFFNTLNDRITFNVTNDGSLNDYYSYFTSYTLTNSSGDTLNHYITEFWLKNTYIIDSFNFITQSWLGINYIATGREIADMITSMLNTGEISLNDSLTATRVDTSDQVISTVSTVDENAVVSGPFLTSVIPYNKIVSVLNSIKAGILKYSDAIRSLRITTVPDTSTTTEIVQAINNLADTVPTTTTDDALTNILTIPQTATDTIAGNTEQVSAVQHIAHAIANTIADIRGVPRPYPDEEPDAGPAGDPYLDGWQFPSLDPDNPDPGGTDPESTEDANRAADVVNGLAFVSGFIGSFYNASKGYNMVFTVGISFVIFSVIIGASHFFGAMFGSHVSVNGPSTIKELNASREAQIRVQQRAYQKSLKQKRKTG